MSDGGLIRLSGGGADWINSTGGMFLIHFSAVLKGLYGAGRMMSTQFCMTSISAISSE